jgi:hypothetical protein
MPVSASALNFGNISTASTAPDRCFVRPGRLEVLPRRAFGHRVFKKPRPSLGGEFIWGVGSGEEKRLDVPDPAASRRIGKPPGATTLPAGCEARSNLFWTKAFAPSVPPDRALNRVIRASAERGEGRGERLATAPFDARFLQRLACRCGRGASRYCTICRACCRMKGRITNPRSPYALLATAGTQSP